MVPTELKKTKAKNYRLQHCYGITLAEYNKILKLQKGVCGICGVPPGTRALHLDHKHQPKEKQLRKKREQVKIRAMVRGLLCWKCNTAIAKFRDNPGLLDEAAAYIRTPPARKVLS